jgi:O-antigen/teichoic acid export membrane protein
VKEAISTADLEPPAAEAPEGNGRANVDLLSTQEAGPAAARGGAMRSSAFLAGSLFVLGSAALLFRHLGVVETGRYTTASSLGSVVVGFTDLGLTAIGIRELAVLRGEQRADLARNLFGMRLVLTVLGSAIVTAFAFAVYGRLMGFGVLIASCGVLAQNVQATFAVSLIARLRLGWVSVLDFARYLAIAGLIVLFVLLGAHLLAFLAVTAIAALIVLPPTIALVRSDIPIRPSFDARQWRRLLGPLLAYSAATAAATLYVRIAIVLVSLIADARQLGYFGVSYRMVEALLVLPTLLVGAAFPIFARAAREDPARLRFAISRVFDAALIMGAWVSLSLIIGSHLIIAVIAGASFMPSAPVLAFQGIALGAVFISSVWAYGLLSLGLHRVILIFNLALLAAVAVVVAILAALYGAEGAAIGTAAVEIVSAIAGGVVLAHGRPHLKLSLKTLPKVAIAAAIGAAPALLGGVPAIGRVCLSTFLYATALLLLKAFPPDLLAILLPLRAKRQNSRF